MAGDLLTNNPGIDFYIVCPQFSEPLHPRVTDRSAVTSSTLYESFAPGTLPYLPYKQILTKTVGSQSQAVLEAQTRRERCDKCRLCTRQINTATGANGEALVNIHIFNNGQEKSDYGQFLEVVPETESMLAGFKFVYERRTHSWQPNPEYVAPAQPVQPTKTNVITAIWNYFTRK